MADSRLHIVSFDVPYPADYGGVIDVFYRIKALHELGVNITLHCYEYGRGMPEELKEYVDEVQYYRRRKSIVDWMNKLPFIVKTRSSKFLIRNLLKDDAPILFEGIHTTFFLGDDRLKHRIKIVRTHNIEHEYYQKLADQSAGIKRKFYLSESKKLQRYESVLKHADHILAIKESDAAHFRKYCTSTTVLPASIHMLEQHDFNGTRPYFLYHGNLSVAENVNGAKWLVENVFAPLEWCNKLLITGKNPTDELKDLCRTHGVMLTPNPTEQELNTVLELARVHVFYSDQSTGVKLKLLNALQCPGHVIVNPAMVKGTPYDVLCSVALDAEDYRHLVREKIAVEPNFLELEQRQAYITENLDTKENCRRIVLTLLQ